MRSTTGLWMGREAAEGAGAAPLTCRGSVRDSSCPLRSMMTRSVYTEWSFTPPDTVSPTACTLAVCAFGPRIASPLCGSLPAMIPVRTRGTFEAGALASSDFGTGAVPKRCALAIVATSTMRAGAPGRGGAAAECGPRSPPARSVTRSAACTPSASARNQVAKRGPSASSSARQRSGGGRPSSQDAAFMGTKAWA